MDVIYLIGRGVMLTWTGAHRCQQGRSQFAASSAQVMISLRRTGFDADSSYAYFISSIRPVTTRPLPCSR